MDENADYRCGCFTTKDSQKLKFLADGKSLLKQKQTNFMGLSKKPVACHARMLLSGIHVRTAEDSRQKHVGMTTMEHPFWTALEVRSENG
jgi:hypothetical protein